MANRCIICYTEKTNRTSLTFHRFPKDPILKNNWIRACNLDESTVKRNSVICSHHFRFDDFDDAYFGKNKLLPNAVPAPSSYKKVQSDKNKQSYSVVNTTINFVPEYHQSKTITDEAEMEWLGIEHNYANCPNSIKSTSATIDVINQNGTKPATLQSEMESDQEIGMNFLQTKFDLNDKDSSEDDEIEIQNFIVRTPAPSQSEQPSQQDSTSDETQTPVDYAMDNIQNINYIGEVTLNHFSTLEKARNTLQFIFGVIREKNSKIKTLHREKIDLERRIQTIRNVLEDLHDNEIISQEAMRLIRRKFPSFAKKSK